MQTHPLIALTGYSRCGKDTAADALVSIGYERRCFGDIIKHLVHVAGPREWEAFSAWLSETNRSAERLSWIAAGWSLVKDVGHSPFTQEDNAKKLLRPLLEDYGIWKYDEVVEQFFHNLPAKCVNSRLCRVDEGKMWRDRGGIIVEISRAGNDAHTEVERQWMVELREAGLIDATIENGGSLEKLQEAIKAVAAGR